MPAALPLYYLSTVIYFYQEKVMKYRFAIV